MTATAYITLGSEYHVQTASQDASLRLFHSPTPNLTIAPYQPKNLPPTQVPQQQFMQPPQNAQFIAGGMQPQYPMGGYDQGQMMPYSDPNVQYQQQLAMQLAQQPPAQMGMGQMSQMAGMQPMEYQNPQMGYQNPQMGYMGMAPQMQGMMGMQPQMQGMMQGYMNPMQNPQQLSPQQYPMQPVAQMPMGMPQGQQMYQQMPAQPRSYSNQGSLSQSFDQYGNSPQQMQTKKPMVERSSLPMFDSRTLSGSEADMKHQIGNHIYGIVEQMHGGEIASKVTGLILMLDFQDLVKVVETPTILASKIEEGYRLVIQQSR
ncbi:hypothetical protein BLNAU_7683 [Blattamonas nauphoetae]|uniref:PABC domain-containing protein n=1 Tax=Blattamonas nauphoetae TaxID=2049346 RepID=A0ABQ9Y0P2_9EUKA|nr:hypothetical protein BLNAU_7683 [Blattamonas nauphoetae]